jgi:hypothetical protein
MNKPKMTKRGLPLGISRVWVKPGGNRKPYEAFQVSGSPDGVRKNHRVVIHVRGEKAALKLAMAKRAEWEKTSKPWGKAGGRPARMRVDPDSVPDSMKFPGLFICRHRAIVMATRSVMIRRKERNFYLCFPYSIEGGSLPTFSEAMEQCRRGQGVLNGIPRETLFASHSKVKTANLQRKRGETMEQALLSFEAFSGNHGTFQEVAAVCHAYEKRAS